MSPRQVTASKRCLSTELPTQCAQGWVTRVDLQTSGDGVLSGIDVPESKLRGRKGRETGDRRMFIVKGSPRPFSGSGGIAELQREIGDTLRRPPSVMLVIGERGEVDERAAGGRQMTQPLGCCSKIQERR